MRVTRHETRDTGFFRQETRLFCNLPLEPRPAACPGFGIANHESRDTALLFFTNRESRNTALFRFPLVLVIARYCAVLRAKKRSRPSSAPRAAAAGPAASGLHRVASQAPPGLPLPPAGEAKCARAAQHGRQGFSESRVTEHESRLWGFGVTNHETRIMKHGFFIGSLWVRRAETNRS